MLRIPLQKFQIIAFIFLPLAWIVRNTLFLRRREVELYSSVDQAAIAQIIIVLITALVILTSRPLTFWNDLKGTSGRWWIILYLFGMISFFWSINPSYSAYRAFEFLVLSIAIMLLILNSANEETAEKNVLLIAWAVLICEIISKAILSGFSIIAMPNNSSGACAVIIACYSWGRIIADTKGSNKYLIISGIMSTFLVLHSLSTASWWAFLIGMFFISIISRRKVLLFLFFIVLIAAFFYFDQASIDAFLYRHKAGMSFEEALRGRQYLWQDYWLAFQEKPLLGYGFGTAGREISQMYATNAHNFIFAIGVGLGASGLTIFIIYFIKFIFEIIRNLRFQTIFTLGFSSALIAGFTNGLSLSLIGENFITSSYVFIALFSFHLYEYINTEDYLRASLQPDEP